MAITIELLPLTTIEGDGDADVVQEVCESIDTSRYSSAIVTAEVHTNRQIPPGDLEGDLVIEGSDDGQEFVPVLTVRGIDLKEQHLNRTEQPGTPTRLYRFLRWCISPGGAGWQFCGRATVTLK